MAAATGSPRSRAGCCSCSRGGIALCFVVVLGVAVMPLALVECVEIVEEKGDNNAADIADFAALGRDLNSVLKDIDDATVNGNRTTEPTQEDKDLQEEGHRTGTPLTKEEFERAARMPREKTPELTRDFQDPMEVPGAFEGDIMGVNISDLTVKNAVMNPAETWPNGIVPYIISNEFSRQERLRLAQAILEYHSRTCVRFVPRTNQRDYIFFVRGRGCTSLVGRQGGRQYVSLGYGCVHPGIVVHELMHVLGFWHEQSRADRDDFVVVNWRNIAPGMHFNFLKFTWREIQSLGEPYDLNSIMHYSNHAFSRDGRSPTIVARAGGRMGQRDDFSVIDLRKVTRLYECDGGARGQRGPSCSNRHQMCNSWSRSGECQRNTLWMTVNCRAACGTCRELIDCRDDHPRCEEWAHFWQCQSNPDYMLHFCRKSCHACR